MAGGDPGEEIRTLTSGDGVSIHARLTPLPEPSAVLVLCHGLTTDNNEHGAFTALRTAALRAGLGVVRFDFRAHGRSGGTNEMLRLAGLRADVEAVLRLVDERFGPKAPTIPVGLSFGGAAAVHAARARTPCAGLVLWYAVVDYEWNYGVDSAVPFTRQVRAAGREGLPPWAAFPVLTTNFHFPSGLVTEFKTDSTPETLSELQIPVLYYHGRRDPFVDCEPVRRLARSHRNIELRLVPGAGHGFLAWRPWIVRQTARWAARVSQHGR